MGRRNKLQDNLQSRLLNKLQNTEYVDNDVDVDDVDDDEKGASGYVDDVDHDDIGDVDDDEEGAGAYFFGQTQRWSYQL